MTHSSLKLHNLLIIGGEHSDRLEYVIMLAKTVLCQTNKRTAPCNDCVNCSRVNSNTHPNLFLIEPTIKGSEDLALDFQRGDNPDGVIKIERIRRVIVEQQKTNFEHGKSVFIFTHIHKLTKASANALLKALEESNANKLFFALAPSRMAVLPTISSRLVCHRVKPTNNVPLIDQQSLDRITDITRMRPLNRFNRVTEWKVSKDEFHKEIDELIGTCHLLLEQRRINPCHALFLLEALNAAQRNLQRNQNPRLVAEALMFHDWPMARLSLSG